MRYKVVLERSDEGIAVSVPGLPGCHSQGKTENEALENVADAIREYLSAIAGTYTHAETRIVEVELDANAPTAAELRRMPREVRDAIIEASAVSAEHEYRTDPDLMIDYEEIVEESGSHEHDPSTETR